MRRSNRTKLTATTDQQALQKAVELRREQQLATLQEPRFPSTGTEVIATRLAQARARRDRTPDPSIDLR